MSASKKTSSAEILRQIRDGHEDFYADLFNQYLSRLTALVRSRMASRLARKIDPEDVVLSAFRSFFVANREGRFEIDSDDSLWSILVTISLRKLGKHSDYFNSLKRSTKREAETIAELFSKEPTADEAAMIEDELSHLLRELAPQDRKIVELRLQGRRLAEIAEQLGISERTVRRCLQTVNKDKSKGDAYFDTSQLRLMAQRKAETVRLEIPAELAEVCIDDFIIQKHIGTGGMGKVYFGRRLGDEHPVAIKFLKKKFLENSSYVEQFIREAALLQALHHPNIVEFHGIGKLQQRGIFIVMEWVKDVVPLLNTGLLNSEQLLHQKDVVSICLQAARGLLAAHQAGIIHCDVTPTNLLLTANGEVTVSDFGLARKSLETVESRHPAFGTAAFLAPEQASVAWGTVSTKTDVYGLGATMYYLLTGRIPFSAMSVPDIIAEIISPKPPMEIRKLNESVTESVAQFCMLCLNKQPELRPEMALAVEKLLELSQRDQSQL